MVKHALGSTLLFLLFGCSKQPTALDVCHKLEVAGVAAGCRTDQAAGLGAAASEKAAFDLPSVPGQGGQVLRFDKDETYATTATAFANAVLLVGPHMYGSPKMRLFVQLNDGASPAVGARAMAVVDALPGDSSGPPVSTAPPAAKAAASAPVPVAPTLGAAEACAKLIAAGVAKSCGKSDPAPTGDKVTFEIAGMPGRNGILMRMPDDAAFAKYSALVEGTPATSTLRPFVASPKAHIVVHLSPGVSKLLETKTKAAVEAL